MTMFLSVSAFAAAVSLSAQTPTTQRPTTQPQTDAQRQSTDTQRTGNDQAVTVTGCLKAESDLGGTTGRSGTGATSGSTAGGTPSGSSATGRTGGTTGNNYVLTNVKMGQGSSTSAMGLATMYQVKGVSDSEIQRHLNHHVEVTGRISNANAMGSGNRGTTGSGTTAGGSMSGHNEMQEIQATSIKMVAQTCTANQ